MVCGFPLTTLRAQAELLYSFFGVVRHKTSPPLWLVLQYQLVVSAQWMLSGENRNSPLKYFCVWTPLFLLNCFRFPALLFSPISQHDDFCSKICHNFRFFPRPEEKSAPDFSVWIYRCQRPLPYRPCLPVKYSQGRTSVVKWELRFKNRRDTSRMPYS